MASGLPRWPSVTITSAPASSRISRSASCSAAAAARSGSARQPYSRQRVASAACGGRTSTRRSGLVIVWAPNAWLMEGGRLARPARGSGRGGRSREQCAVLGEGGEDGVDVVLDVVEVERDAEVRVALGGDDAVL